MSNTKSLHIRRLAPFGSNIGDWVDEQFQAAKNLFDANTSINLQIVSVELFPFEKGIVRVKECLMGGSSTPDQDTLFASVPNVPATPDDIVVFVIIDFSGWKGGGCAWHPQGQPGCMLTKGKLGKFEWKLAHELGHVLGLFHNDVSTMLMYPSIDWDVTPPLLSNPEVLFLNGNGPAPGPGRDPSLALSDESFRFELSRIEPSYRGFRKYGERAAPLLRRIYETTEEPEYRARAVHATSQAVRRYEDYDGILERAAMAEGPDRAVERRAAADAAGQLLPDDRAERILLRLRGDEEESVRFLAERNLSSSRGHSAS